MAIQEKFPSIRPSLNLDFANTKTLDPRVTFSRASTATYYDGKTVAKAEENLLIRSQEFNNAVWANTATTVTPDSAVAPDGSATADSVIENSSTAQHYLFQSFNLSANTTYSYNVYAKDNGRGFLQLTLFGTTNNYAYAEFDLVQGIVSRSGTLGTNYSVNSTEIQSAGNGWYRCIVIATIGSTTSTTRQRICLSDGVSVPDANANIVYTGDGTSGIYIWGAQLEQRSQVTAYTATTTQPITNYVPVLRTAAANVARFDHNPVTGESLGLLIEEQRTNLLLRSQEFISPWAIQTAKVVNNAAVAPDGSQTAALLVANLGYSYNSNTALVLSQFITLTGGTTYTWSIYAKAAGVGSLAIRNNWTGGITIYNLTDELTTANKQFIGNGWYRCFVTYTPSSTSTNGFSWRPFVSGGTADGYSGIYVWGAQVEAGAFPTSYIKTEASQVTRSADAASMTGANFSSWFNPAEGTVYSEFALKPGGGVYPSPWSIADSTAFGANCTTRIQPYQNGTKTSLGFDVTVANVSQVNIVATVSNLSSFTKHAGAYKFNDFAASSEGSVAGTDTSGVLATNYAQLAIGRDVTGGIGKIGSHIRKIAYYPARLPDATLQAITAS